MLIINDFFCSLQGEGTRAGLRCVFIRLAGCNLRCKWCDTKYALDKQQGSLLSLEEIIKKVEKYNCNFIEITGGEPLLQNDTIELCEKLIDKKYIVAIETNGSIAIKNLPQNVIKIVDVKCPASEMSEHNNYDNFNYLTKQDEIKFVIANDTDFKFACNIIEKYQLYKITNNLLFSAVSDMFSPHKLAELILNCNNPKYNNIIRLQIQLHKIIEIK